MAASRKVYSKPTNNYQQFVNAFVADECRCSPSLLLQQAKTLADTTWKAADYGEDKVVVSDVLSSSANDSEHVTKYFVVPVAKFQSITPVLASPFPDYMQSTVEELSVEMGSSDCTPRGMSSVSSRSESVVAEFLKVTHFSIQRDYRFTTIPRCKCKCHIYGSPDKCRCSLSSHWC